MKLLLFPFAGGSSFSYNPLTKYLPADIDSITVELPGRGRRMNEPFISSVHEIVEDLFMRYKHLASGDYAIFGHSFGTLLGLLFTRKILSSRLKPPSNLFFSGRFGPAFNYCSNIHQLPQKEFIKQIILLGGSPAEIFGNSEILDFYLPILRSDFKALESYRYDAPYDMDLPVTILYGKEDPNTSLDALQIWQHETKRKIELVGFSGGHFFLFDHPLEIMNLITLKMKKQG